MAARNSSLSASIGVSAPSGLPTCQKVQPLQASSPCTAAPTRWMEPSWRRPPA